MHLEGQATERGYALAAVLISVAIMSIVMSALLPVWRHQSQREKEAELAFRGEQYARAIYLYQTKNGGQYPPSLDVLVQGRYIRKKYKDPMTADGEFLPLSVGANQPGPQGGQAGRGGQGGSQPGAGGAGNPMGGGQRGSGLGGQPTGMGGQPMGGVQGGAGIMTVVSKSKDASIRIYNGGTHYNEWRFVYNARGRGANQQPAPGGGPTQGQPGMGGRGQGGSGQGGQGGPARGGGPGSRGGSGLGSGGVRTPGGRGQ